MPIQSKVLQVAITITIMRGWKINDNSYFGEVKNMPRMNHNWTLHVSQPNTYCLGHRCLLDEDCGTKGTCILKEMLPTSVIWKCLLDSNHPACPPGLAK